ncbi:hypothetical protein BN1058_00977 [Paraliobacillus sp. PM-2]|nr:hypothetical protein BN1058_00977 [Paraliobacillus sp. PM-2]
MKKGQSRNRIAIFILLFITCSSLTIPLKHVSINVSIIILLIVGIMLLAHSKKKLFLIIACLLLSHIYAGLKLWEIVSPVWIFLPKIIIYSSIFLCLLVLTSSNILERFIITSLSVIIGEVIYALIVVGLGWEIIIGDQSMMLLLGVLSGAILFYRFMIEIKMKFQDILQLVEQHNKRWTNE